MHAQTKSRIFGCVHIKCANYIAELTVSPFPPFPPTYAGFLLWQWIGLQQTNPMDSALRSECCALHDISADI